MNLTQKNQITLNDNDFENLTKEQYQLLFTSVRYYQTKKSLSDNDKKLYNDCESLLDLIYPYAYPYKNS